jgi:gamma-glutamylcyclotransferase (GGCT)/AIG2-like uncharacterized protein YtfP
MHKATQKYEYLFSYGTLQFENVQRETFGRLLEGKKDRLVGCCLSMIEIKDEDVVKTSGATHHPVVKPSENRTDFVDGTVFQITEQELAHADKYEVDAYVRITVELESGISAWVYVDAQCGMVKVG